MKNQKKKDNRPVFKTRVKPNNSIEVEIQRSPGSTLLGKIFIFAIVFGMTLLGLVGLILVIIEAAKM